MNMISHAERMRTSSRPKIEFTPTLCVRQVRKTSVNPTTKHVTTKVEFVTIDRAEEMRPYCVSDFSMDNLIAIGANLDTTTLTASPHRVISDMKETLSNLENNTEK